MDTLGLSELKKLAGIVGPQCVSIYLPTHPTGEVNRQDAVRLQVLLQRAEDGLVSGGLRPSGSKDLLVAARELPNRADFWGKRSQGLAILLSPRELHAYRLPLAFDEAVTIRDRFHIKPLLPVVDRGDCFFLLTLSQKSVRLFRLTRALIEEVRLENFPAPMREALNYTADRGEQVHAGARGGGGKEGAVFHGQGGMPDAAKSDLAQYFQMVDRALRPVLDDKRTPLLLAGVDYLLPIFRRASSYRHIAARDLTGNCDYLADHQLHASAWRMMGDWFDRPRREALERLEGLIAAGRGSTQTSEVLAAAVAGKVDTLLADGRRDDWGQFDPRSQTTTLFTTPRSECEDLVNRAIVEVLVRGGTVYAAQAEQFPGGGPMAAIFRY